MEQSVVEQNFEVIVIGAGPAAWSAATYLGRADVRTLVIGKPEDSGLFDAAEVWNYPGFIEGISGKNLLDNMMTQALTQGAVFKKSEVTHVALSDTTMRVEDSVVKGRFFVRTADRQEFFCDNLVLAHGANHIKVDLPGEDLHKGRGVHYCALCDGPAYKGKHILVIGNGSYAADEAVQLSAHAESVKVVTHATEPNFSAEYLELFKRYGIGIINQRVAEFTGINGVLTGVKLHPPVSRYESVGQLLAHEADAAFVAIGVASSHAFARSLGVETHGSFLKADEFMRTNVAGVWVAGLARGGVNQIVKSVGDGGVAAVDIIKTVKGLPQYLDHA